MRNSRAPLLAEENAARLDGIDPDLDKNADATPLPIPDAAHVTIHNRQAPGCLGKSGIFISTFADAECKNNQGFNNYELSYRAEIVFRLKSFTLSSAISPDDMLGYSAEDPCTRNVMPFSAANTTSGCHTLPQEINCIMIGC